MPRSVAQIIEDIESLKQAWPTAPREIWDELQEELEQAWAATAPRLPDTELIRHGETLR